ncbi:hypothetical protein BDR05DRAFT_993839 [Suillus weaverae]|nr:hypothetical protein BDR05DRAFT_993839 [Suillus weaverae]
MLDDEPELYLVISTLVVAVNQAIVENLTHPPLSPNSIPLPVLRNVLSLDPARPWLTFNAWRSTYGCKPVLVVDSEEVVKDLFERCSTIYPNKPQSIVYKAFVSYFNMGFMPYGDSDAFTDESFIRYFIKLLHPLITLCNSVPPTNVVQSSTGPWQLSKPFSDVSRDKLFGLVLKLNCIRFTLTFMLSIIYDCEAKAEDDHVAHTITRYGELIVDGFAPAAMMLMETFPFLLQLPSWFPGHDMKEIPFRYVKERMSANDTEPSLVADALNRTSQVDDVNTTAVKDAAPSLHSQRRLRQ